MPRESKPHRDHYGRWRFRFRGRQYLFPAHTPEKKVFAALAALQLDESEPAAIETVADVVTAWRRIHSSTWSIYRSAPFLEWSAGRDTLSAIGPGYLIDYAEWLRRYTWNEKPLSPKTIFDSISVARSILSLARDRGLLTVMPDKPRVTKPPRRPRDIPRPLLENVMRSLPPAAARPLCFMLETGCRPGEAAGLRWEYLDFLRNVAILPQHKTAHQGKSRTIYLSAMLGGLRSTHSSAMHRILVHQKNAIASHLFLPKQRLL